MKAVFEFTYETDAGLDVDVHIEGDIYDESDKESLLYAIAEILGRKIAVKETYEEQVFGGMSEDQDNG
jgi:hypothetical protein